MRKLGRRIAAYCKKDPIGLAALVLAAVSACIVKPSAAYLDSIDWKVLALLLSLMWVVAGLREAGVFAVLTERLLGRVHTLRALAAVLVGACFFSGMIITNDVALITFVPLAILLLTETGLQGELIPVIVLETLAANLGSSLTPLGNPQNLYLYALSGMSLGRFLAVMAPPVAAAALLLAAAVLCLKPRTVEPRPREAEPLQKGKTLLWALLFILCLLVVLRVVHYAIALGAVLLAVVLGERKLLPRADFGLLLTFIFFFIFIGNMKTIPWVSGNLSRLVAGREKVMGILLSQVISNVPAAMLLSGFTDSWETLLLGVNLGGLGTMIASMASMIAYKLYAATEGAKTGRYLAVFTGANVLFLAILWAVTALI